MSVATRQRLHVFIYVNMLSQKQNKNDKTILISSYLFCDFYLAKFHWDCLSIFWGYNLLTWGTIDVHIRALLSERKCDLICFFFIKNRLKRDRTVSISNSVSMLIVLGKMRSAVGSAQLLMSQKFQQFRELCEENLVSVSHSQSPCMQSFPTTFCIYLTEFWIS